MKDIKTLYDKWSDTYDHVRNRTRDLEQTFLQWALSFINISDHCLEVGCGTAKNTASLLAKSKQITAIDISACMLEKARKKVESPNVSFLCLDINQEWPFPSGSFDLVTFSLILEHIDDLDPIFQ